MIRSTLQCWQKYSGKQHVSLAEHIASKLTLKGGQASAADDEPVLQSA